MNIAKPLWHAAEWFPEKPFVIQNDVGFPYRCITYGLMRDYASRWANYLGSVGVAPQERVAVFVPKIPEWFALYWGTIASGAVIVSLNPSVKDTEFAYYLRDCTPQLVVVHDEMLPFLDSVLSNAPWVRHIVVANPAQPRVHATLRQALSVSSPAFRPRDMQPDELASLMYTGGTTGTSKGIPSAHGNSREAYFGDYAEIMQIHSGDVMLLAVPLFHGHANWRFNHPAVASGATIVLMRQFDAERALKLIELHRVTLVSGPPTFYARFLEVEHPERFNLSSWKKCFSGAAPLSSDIKERFESRFGIPIFEGGGASEGVGPFSEQFGLPRRRGSVGVPLSNATEVKLVDEDGKTVPPGTIGKALARGPGVFSGYWNNPEATAEVLRDGWFHSGDLMMRDDDGYFYFVGRTKDYINRGGEKIFPREVEEELQRHPAVREVAVVGVPSAELGEEIKVFAVLRLGESCSEDELRQYCRTRLSYFKVPRFVEFVEALPRTEVGKVLYRDLRGIGDSTQGSAAGNEALPIREEKT